MPWDALTPDQPGPGDNWQEIRLGYAHRDRPAGQPQRHPLRGIFEAPEPARPGTTARRLALAAALLAAAIVITDVDSWVHYLSIVFTFAGADQLLSAYRGWRAARRARATT